jgi:hypothetical protein
MNNRRRLLAPFPLVPEQLYRTAWTLEERAAIRVLAPRNIEMFRLGTLLLVHLPSILVQEVSKRATITINLPRGLPMAAGYSMIIPYENLLPEQINALEEWTPHWLELYREQAMLIAKTREVGKICSTYRQLYRLWPDILSFFDNTGAQAVCEAKAQSRYPSGALLYDHARSLKPEFRPEAFAPFTSMIAECLMLPEDKTKEVASVAVI